MILRDYQKTSIALVMACFQKHRDAALAGDVEGMQSARFELLVLATGAGKTVIFCEIIRLVMQNYGQAALILAHRDMLLDQARDKYLDIKPNATIGKLAGSVCELGGEVTVASVQTAAKPKRIKQLQAFHYGLIIVDEGHHIAANGYQTVLNAFPDAFVLIVTATPDRLDGKKIIEKDPLFTKSLIDLVKEKYLCPPRAIAIKTDVSLDEVKTRGGDFDEKALSEAVDDPTRNKLIALKYLEHCASRPFIGFGVTVEHATSMAYTFNDLGIACATITGATPTEERQRLYAAVRDGSLQGLWSVQVLTEGFDEPCISCIINARPTKSRALYVQCIGRGARLFPGKEDFIILDITDNCLKHRIEARNFNKSFDLRAKDLETIEEMEAREEKEAEEEREKQKQIRRLKDKRQQDLAIDLLQRFDWKKRDQDGAYIVEFGTVKHKLALKPETSINNWDQIPEYTVWASLAPTYQIQQWTTTAQPLTEALEYAEAKILKLTAEPMSIKLMDRNAEWRTKPIDPDGGQVQMALKFHLPWQKCMSKGELSDMIDGEMKRRQARRDAKKQRA
jgi:superfamily II DNA or RNA helicase